LRRWSPGPISQHCWASTIGGLLEAVPDRYERYVAPHVLIAQPTLAEIGRLLLALEAWSAVRATDSITAYTREPG
jgi:hypothetical protein